MEKVFTMMNEPTKTATTENHSRSLGKMARLDLRSPDASSLASRPVSTSNPVGRTLATAFLTCVWETPGRACTSIWLYVPGCSMSSRCAVAGSNATIDIPPVLFAPPRAKMPASVKVRLGPRSTTVIRSPTR
jgi:hypothetical protein